jgi:alkylhydroperoxidase/carboxymuconolactone decarboxylase family protein YurZ
VEPVKSEDDWAFVDGALPKLLIAAAFDAAHGATHGARFLAEHAVKAGSSKEEAREAFRVAYVMSDRGSVHVAAKNLFRLVLDFAIVAG